MKNAIISVYDKSGLETLVNYLVENDYNIWSSGGTYRHISSLLEGSDRVNEIDKETHFPEILGGRVKTLHPRLYGGILADRENSEHETDMRDNKLKYFDLVVVNLYPFSDTVSGGCSEADAIENIDIGGVSLIRAAAKNYKYLSVLVDQTQYEKFISVENTLEYRRELASNAFRYITKYDSDITTYFNPSLCWREYNNMMDLKYGLNPSQKSAHVASINGGELPFKLINGNPGYINMIDMIQSWQLVSEVTNLTGFVAVTSFKHTTPTGLALATDITKSDYEYFNLKEDMTSSIAVAYMKARDVDPLSSFGDFVAISGIVDYDTAMAIRPEVTDGIIALGYEPGALEILKRKKSGKYIILLGKDAKRDCVEFKEYGGSMCLVEDTLETTVGLDELESGLCTRGELTTDAKLNMVLANTVLKYTPSNSVAFAYRNMVLGVGAGQQNRVDCVRLAGNKYHNWLLRHHPEVVHYRDELYNSRDDSGKRKYKRQTVINMVYDYVKNIKNIEGRCEYLCEKRDNVTVASDGFFPFPDGITTSSIYGVNYVIQPGGSIGDTAVIEKANELDITMVMTGKRMFFH